MALSINGNIAALTARRHLNESTNQLGKTFARLSSGLRVNSAADDAAGLSIAGKMTAQIRGTNQAIRNANDAISLVQVADGALDETESALQRMRELAVQAASDTYTTSDRQDLQTELDELISEVARIASDTEFNDKTLLLGGINANKIQVGPDAGQTIAMTIDSASATDLGVNAVNISQQTVANTAITTLDSAIASVSDIRATLGAVQNRMESAIASLSNISENTEAARSRIMDADIATETSNLTRNAILQQAGTAVLAQANQQPQLALLLLN
ncbi:MAG: flagellin FliC [Magnetococcales bacterium]|nr:flagellin FliC [Magnetococcales bacterium]